MIRELRLKRLTDDTFYISFYSPTFGEEEYSFPNSAEMFAFLIKEFLNHRELEDIQNFISRLVLRTGIEK